MKNMESTLHWVKALLSPNHFDHVTKSGAASTHIKEPDYQALTLKLYELERAGLEDFSLSYILSGDQIGHLKLPLEASKDIHGFDELYESIWRETGKAFEILYGYIDEIEGLEEAIYTRNSPRYFMDLWFKIKKDMGKIERSLTRAALALREFIRVNEEALLEKKSGFKDLASALESHSRSCAAQIGKLDGLRDYFSSLKTDKLNGNIYLLALVSGVFLPMNLIVGFFGINTPNLFFHEDPQGTLKVLYILCGVFFVLIFGLPLLRKIDRIVFKKVLGRYNFYRRLSEKIGALKIH